MTNDETLEHHGVKGQKWGVKRYKQMRKQAKGVDGHIGALKNEKQRATKKVDASGARLARAKKIDRGANTLAKNHSNRLTKQIKKSTGKSVKNQTANHKKNTRDLAFVTKTLNKRNKDYASLVNKASKLPVEVRMQRMRQVAKSVGAAALVSYVSGGTKTVVPGRTRKDRFDENVYKKRGGRKGQKKNGQQYT